MAKYKVLATSFINNRLVQEGDTITVDDKVIPGTHWQPVDAAAKKAFKAAGFEAVSAVVDPELPKEPVPDPESDSSGESDSSST